jgi:hypothetical protein
MMVFDEHLMTLDLVPIVQTIVLLANQLND